MIYNVIGSLVALGVAGFTTIVLDKGSAKELKQIGKGLHSNSPRRSLGKRIGSKLRKGR